MADRIFKRRGIAGEPGVDQRKTAAWLDGVLINIVEATRAWRPLQPGVEQASISRPSQKMGTELPNRVKVRTARSHGEPA